MTTLRMLLESGFLEALAAGIAVNLEIAAIALVIGLATGLPLALATVSGGLAAALAAPVIGLLRAAPTFVVMFFLLNTIPADATLLGLPIAPSPIMIVALSLVPYAAAYIADNGREAWRHRAKGERDAALLFLPNLARAFIVLVMSSGAAAAIGVGEGVAVILREADRMPGLDQKLIVFALGVLCFGLVFQTGFALVNALRRRLAARP